MENLGLKVKLSMLWIIYMVEGGAFAMLEFYEPGMIEAIIVGEVGGMQITHELLLLFAVIMLGPLFMAFLSLTLKGSTNRWANIILGLVYTGLGFVGLADYVARSVAYAVLMSIVGIVFTALIVWYAWKWPKEGA